MRQAENQPEASGYLPHAGSLLVLFFDSEDGSDMFFCTGFVTQKIELVITILF
jgi:hypothetical protein